MEQTSDQVQLTASRSGSGLAAQRVRSTKLVMNARADIILSGDGGMMRLSIYSFGIGCHADLVINTAERGQIIGLQAIKNQQSILTDVDPSSALRSPGHPVMSGGHFFWPRPAR